MPTLTYGRAMTWLAERDAQHPALVFEGETRSRGALEARSNRLARAYAERGVRHGDLVTLALPNGIEFFEACLAIWKLGATPQPISARLPEIERSAIVELASPSLVVGVPAGHYGDRACVDAGFEPASDLSGKALPDAQPPCARAMTTGGSTGRPKLILDLSPATCDPEAPQNRMRRGGTTLVPGPLYHAGPFMTAWLQLLCGGRAIVLRRFDAARCLALIEQYAVDWVLFVPTMMQRIWRLPESERTRYDLSSLDTVMCTGAPSAPWLKRAWIEWLGGDRIHEAYGGSERIAGTQISGTEWLAHPGSVGKPTAGRKIRILRADGTECDPGEVGEIYMMPAAGQGSTYRYVGAQATATQDGWETLGDLGYLDADGYLYIVDRKTDMIVTGGANVYPAEVEAALDAHPSVRSSAVIGLPDADLGQRVHALVDAPDGLEEASLREHMAEQLVPYKLPRSYEFVAEPLRDDAGKVRRQALRDARVSAAADSSPGHQSR